MEYTIYFPENLANYNFAVATVIGVVIIVLVVGIIIGISKFKKSRRTPE